MKQSTTVSKNKLETNEEKKCIALSVYNKDMIWCPWGLKEHQQHYADLITHPFMYIWYMVTGLLDLNYDQATDSICKLTV